MFSIRNNVFETNSSSTHSITMCTESDYNKWKEGKLLYDREMQCLIDQKEIKDYFNINDIKYFIDNDLDLEHNEIDDLYKKYTDDKSLTEYILSNYYEEFLKSVNVYTYNSFWKNDGYDPLDKYREKYTTPNGETVIAFGEYGSEY